MDLDLQCQELVGTKWKELIPSLNQYKTIRLDDCSLVASNCEDLASVLKTNQTLTELKLNNNELQDAGVDLLCKGLLNSSCKLQKLWLRNCNLTKGCCKSLRVLLSGKPGLTELQLNDNNLGSAGAKELCQGLLDPSCQLESLHMDFCEVSAEAVEMLSNVLRTKPSLKEVNLSNNKFEDTGVASLFQSMLDPNCNLRSLHLENCGFTEAACEKLSAVLSAKPCLTELYIGENKIGNAGIALLCRGVLEPSCKIEKLSLWECNISAAGCKELSNVISTKETLRELNLIGNEIKDEGMDIICQGLKSPNTKLESLWARECGLTSACCQSISSALAVNGTLKELHIGSNKLRDEGVIQLCEGVMSPTCKLRSLWLGLSGLTSACCGTLAQVMVGKPCLEELDVSYSQIEDEGARILCEAVKNPNCHLKYLMLYDTYWSSEVDDELNALEELKPGFKLIT
ncbi:ribonuclease inhibitor [Varanus komodoensis]|uniref:Ribonuclease inhibitor n=1 Tax=Varanus komodoensis TaxID=61221 RepID=A0A8D2J232_VARKO|nr:ribonuclease inhibitor [Varanus komodoensis]XP_044281848.1 ribonuclease inhibitor [Varanus komodoensis]XP_044281849.1 ribonuclease inhibitor [Varanus komodoensis]